MKFECPNCSALVEPVDFKVQGEMAGWTCKECGASVSMGAVSSDKRVKDVLNKQPPGDATETEQVPGDATETEKVTGDATETEKATRDATETEKATGDATETEKAATAEATGSCPKCGADWKNRGDCPRCGLVFSKWNPTKLEEFSDDRLDPLWEKVVEDFENAGVHDKFMDTALRLNRLDFAAAKYRGYGVSNPTKKERTRELLERVSSMAQFQVLRVEEGRRKEKKKTASPKKKKLMWGIILLLLLALLYIAFLWSPKPSNPGGRDSDFKPGSQPVNLKRKLDGGG